jgi:hypothetical protein
MNSDNESVPDKYGRTSRRNNGDGGDDDPDDPDSDTEEDNQPAEANPYHRTILKDVERGK